MLIPILTLAATCTAFADLERKDSSEFDYKYEMIKLPTEEDVDGNGKYDFTGGDASWMTCGSGADAGTILMDMSKGNKSLTSSADIDTTGDLWKKMGVTHQTGYTIETHLKILESTGSAGAFFLNASLTGGNYNCFLYFFTDHLNWGSTKVSDIDATQWHTYRVVRLAGEEKYHLYIDGTLVSDNLANAYGNTLYRLIFGAGGANYKSKVRVEYLRLTTGAFAPQTEKDTRLSSDEFDVKYEMSADDTSISTSTSTSDWTINGTSNVTITKENGVLSVTPQQGKQPYWITTDKAWKNLVTFDTSYTVEFSTKIRSCTLTNGGDRTLQFWVATPRATGNIIIGEKHVYWQISSSMGDNIELDSSDNTDKMHKFRIAFDGETHGGFTVWRDDVKIGEKLGDLAAYNGASYSFARFGIPGSTSGGAFDIGYIRWTLDGVHSPYTRKGLMVIVK